LSEGAAAGIALGSAVVGAGVVVTVMLLKLLANAKLHPMMTQQTLNKGPKKILTSRFSDK